MLIWEHNTTHVEEALALILKVQQLLVDQLAVVVAQLHELWIFWTGLDHSSWFYSFLQLALVLPISFYFPAGLPAQVTISSSANFNGTASDHSCCYLILLLLNQNLQQLENHRALWGCRGRWGLPATGEDGRINERPWEPIIALLCMVMKFRSQVWRSSLCKHKHAPTAQLKCLKYLRRSKTQILLQKARACAPSSTNIWLSSEPLNVWMSTRTFKIRARVTRYT